MAPALSMITAMPRVSSPVFVGRAAELEHLERALDDAANGRPATKLVAGEAGIGKTRLVIEFTDRARSAGAQVLVGHCLQVGDTGLAYAPIAGALRPLLRTRSRAELERVLGPAWPRLAHLLPDLEVPPSRPDPDRRDTSSVAGGASKTRLFEAILSALRRLADERPLVLVLEDLHWADSSTLDLLRFLVRNARDAPLLVVATYRSDELHRRHPLRPLLAELARLDEVATIELPAFDERELAEQLAGIMGEVAMPELVAAVLARSGGNPFFAEELVAAGEAGLALPRTLRDTLADHVRRYGAGTRQLLRVASVAGGRIDHEILAVVADLPADALDETIRDAVEHHLLMPTPPDEAPGYAFRHALLQEAVYEELLPSERTRLHAAYAEAIEARPELTRSDPLRVSAQLAHHWLMAHVLDRALPATIAAARAAAAGFAFAEALAFFERALELWPKVSPESLPSGIHRTTILEEGAEAAAQAGDAHRSIELVRAALAETDPIAASMRAGVLQHRLAWYLNEAGDWQSGVTALERAVELIPIDPPSPERARVLSDMAHSLMVRSRFGDSLVIAEAALAISRAVGARGAEARALNALGVDLACRSDFERSLPILRSGHALALEIGDPQAIFLTAVGLGWALDESACHTEALDLATSAAERFRELGAEARYGGQMASKVGRALWEMGRWDEADAVMSAALAAGPTRYAARWLLSNRIRLRVHRGELDAARLDLRTHDSLGERVIGPDPDLLSARRAELAIEAHEPTLARELVRETLDRLGEPELDTDARALFVIGAMAEVDEADAARAAGDQARTATAIGRADELLDQARGHLARVREIAARPAALILADHALVEALVIRVRAETAPEAWQAAVDLRRRVERPFELARVLAFAAEADLAARRRDRAEAMLAEAHDIARRLGAGPLRARIEALARRARMHLDGVESATGAADRLRLTPREREVLALVAEGRSNRQIGELLFMAESTAGVHVSNILAKLGVARRSEAAVVAHRMGLADVG
jgi:DNA-binding NarL/FixJ family response regulator